ncbi:hypothetical protein AVEN_223409-1, partial [Araneus ventricosus]
EGTPELLVTFTFSTAQGDRCCPPREQKRKLTLSLYIGHSLGSSEDELICDGAEATDAKDCRRRSSLSLPKMLN